MKKVMVFGVFDLLHPGHISFLKQARALGDLLVVSVARDANVKKVKGYKPIQSEKQRAVAIKKLKFIDQVILGGKTNPWPHIRKINPDIIALGYDQKSYVDMHELKKIAKVVRLKAYRPKIHKSSKILKRRS